MPLKIPAITHIILPSTKPEYRDIPVPRDFQWILDYLRKLNDGEEFLFMHNGKRLTIACIRDRLRRVNKNVEQIQSSPNKIRKTYCSMLVNNNIDDKTIAKSLATQTSRMRKKTAQNHKHKKKT